ncbi:hypothetical protein M409DRAFT_19442 [Zasmidium cellare ATCC 36951]|uniref:Uncharacterized protein n=1 Tax=Zasmidium cellare ATCC 36951 TaxID=1080233 RepID=A0A6A6CZ30_ZASCE|nr:uncharacterized protein M409DRAFT_19442 [Zasmidium cellare ATCC 36951]KAF2170626.1 hypothetical protein M409DRAFT_19442 [Zasmidium cellare ATCC 36951]
MPDAEAKYSSVPRWISFKAPSNEQSHQLSLLGPFPDNFTVVPQLNPAIGNIVPFFQNTDNGETTFWDPSIDWTELEVKSTDGPSYKIGGPPGESERHAPTSDYSFKHGTELVETKLI